MSLHEIKTEIGFSDGEVIGCARTGDTLTVYVKAWNDVQLRVVFKNVIFVRDFLPGSVCGFYEYEGSTELMETALAYTYNAIPENHPYKHYTFLNNDESPCLDIVASSEEVK